MTIKSGTVRRCIVCKDDLTDTMGCYVFVDGKVPGDRDALTCVNHGANSANNFTAEMFTRLYTETFADQPDWCMIILRKGPDRMGSYAQERGTFAQMRELAEARAKETRVAEVHITRRGVTGEVVFSNNRGKGGTKINA